MDAKSQKCGYTGYAQKYLTYPPNGPLPLPSGTDDPNCDVWSDVVFAALNINPAFDIYRIFDTVSITDVSCNCHGIKRG